MAFFIIDDNKESKEQMRSNMRDSMRRHYRGGSPGSGGAFRGGINYRTGEAYKEGYTHGWRDHEDEMEEEYRRGRDSHGRFV